MENDLISRQAAVDAPKRFTKDCNPEHFVGHSNFIEYMDTVGIRSFGNWQYANGFNMGLTAAEVAIEKLPSAQQWIPVTERLPGYGEDVLVSIGGYCNVGHIVPTNDEKQYNWYYSGWYHDPYDVDAWMPLPEPWKGESDETD